jgi:CheY-like chemotaxis protein
LTTLLAVDDSITMRKVIEITFAGEDYQTVLASTADEAMEKLYQASPSVALVDVSLGATDGYELCQRIKGELPKTRVLLMSSKQNPFDAGRGAAVGVDGHIDKPFDSQAMIDKVRALASAPSQAAAQPATTPMAPPPVAAPPQPAAVSIAAHNQAPSLEFEAPVLEPPVLEPLPPDEPPILEPEIIVGGSDELEAVTIEPPEPSVPPPAPIPAAPAVPSNGRSAGAGMEARLSELGLSEAQVAGVLALSREVVEQAVWEVVPALAEAMIKEEIARLTR